MLTHGLLVDLLQRLDVAQLQEHDPIVTARPRDWGDKEEAGRGSEARAAEVTTIDINKSTDRVTAREAQQAQRAGRPPSRPADARNGANHQTCIYLRSCNIRERAQTW